MTKSPLNGVVVIDKPQGLTSREVSDIVKRKLNAKKTGHSGTLDLMVSGVLPVGIDHGTRILKVLLMGRKEYVGVLHLHKDVSERKLKKVFEKFTGVIVQTPPARSAVKRIPRKREIYSLELLEKDGKDVLFRVESEAGTYIRKLCHEIGQVLGVGAHMAELRRTRVSHFREEDAVALEDLSASNVLPVESMVESTPKVWIKDSTVGPVMHGVKIAVPGISRLDKFENRETVAIMTLKDELVAIGSALESSRKILKMRKGIVVKVDRVVRVMDKDLLEILACPKCKKGLDYKKLRKKEFLICRNCRLAYPIIDDIPHMLIEEAEKI